MSTTEHPGPFDAMEKLEHPNEPHFKLLGRDHAAPGAITEWCRLRRNAAIEQWGLSTSEADKLLLKGELMQCGEAEAIALEMTDFRLGQGEIEGAKATYQEVKRTEAGLAEADLRKRKIAAVRHLREAAYHYSEAIEFFEGQGDLVGDMQEALATINRKADDNG